jgi:hypothetical protein
LESEQKKQVEEKKGWGDMEDDDEEDKDKPIGIEKKEETKHKV